MEKSFELPGDMNANVMYAKTYRGKTEGQIFRFKLWQPKLKAKYSDLNSGSQN